MSPACSVLLEFFLHDKDGHFGWSSFRTSMLSCREVLGFVM